MSVTDQINPDIDGGSAQEQEPIESQRFTKHSPGVTLLLMSIGPLSLLISAIAEALDMLMVSKRFNKEPESHAIQILGYIAPSHLLLQLLGTFFSQCIIVRVTNLVSAGNRQSATQVVADIYRIAFVSCLTMSLVFFFAAKPFLKVCGCPSMLLQPAFEMLQPYIYLTFITSFSSLGVGFIQAIGRPILSAGVKCTVYLLQLCLFTPLLLFGFKVNARFIKWAPILAQACVGLPVFVLIFLGKFDLKPAFSQLKKMFCKETGKALLLACPLILQVICYLLPPILILQSMAEAAGSSANLIGGVFAIILRLSGICTALCTAFTSAFISCATQSIGCHNYKRIISYYKFALLYGFIVMALITPVCLLWPRQIGSLFLSTKGELDLAQKMIKIPFYTAWLDFFYFPTMGLLIVLGKPLLPVIGSIIQTVFACVGAKLIEKYTKNPISITYVLTLGDLFIALYFLCVFIKPFLDLRKKIREQVSDSIDGKTTYTQQIDVEPTTLM